VGCGRQGTAQLRERQTHAARPTNCCSPLPLPLCRVCPLSLLPSAFPFCFFLNPSRPETAGHKLSERGCRPRKCGTCVHVCACFLCPRTLLSDRATRAATDTKRSTSAHFSFSRKLTFPWFRLCFALEGAQQTDRRSGVVATSHCRCLFQRTRSKFDEGKDGEGNYAAWCRMKEGEVESKAKGKKGKRERTRTAAFSRT
jgi:hypothetical protein